jgi:hypothetical protein
MRRVCPAGRHVARKNARVRSSVDAWYRTMARAAGEDASRLVMTARARRSARSSARNSRGTRRCPVVAPTAHVRIVRVEHGCPPRRAQRRPVKPWRARIRDIRTVHAVAIGRYASAIRGARRNERGARCNEERRRAPHGHLTAGARWGSSVVGPQSPPDTSRTRAASCRAGCARHRHCRAR